MSATQMDPKAAIAEIGATSTPRLSRVAESEPSTVGTGIRAGIAVGKDGEGVTLGENDTEGVGSTEPGPGLPGRRANATAATTNTTASEATSAEPRHADGLRPSLTCGRRRPAPTRQF